MNKELMTENMQNPIPIREISRLTGVNSVTLRAWERRYGLIKPLRTNKGHRLYSCDDVELIKTIQAWLARGLAIGKVSELLESGLPSQNVDIENIWQSYLSELLAIMAELNLGKLDAFFNQLFSVYPAALIADQLISPVLDNLNQESFGNRVKKAILINRLSEYLLMLTQRQRQQAKGKRVAIIQLDTAVNPLLNTLLHYGLTMNHVKSELLGVVSVAEVVFAAEQLALDGFIVFNDACFSLGEFQKELIHLTQATALPIVVGGKLIHALTAEFPSHVHLAQGAGQQDVMDVLNTIFPEGFVGEVEHEY
ncbi:MAG TPA: MerR family transcriptional regulator [Cellvibrio sp.]|nr:MerR family transcriptional regulator [Cellvibrio sp.]